MYWRILVKLSTDIYSMRRGDGVWMDIIVSSMERSGDLSEADNFQAYN
jgi:hypothetical protein